MTVLGSNLKTDFEGNFVFENIWPGRRRPCPGTNQCHSPSLSLSLLLSLPSLSLVYLSTFIYLYLSLSFQLVSVSLHLALHIFIYLFLVYLPTYLCTHSISFSLLMHVRTYLFACTYVSICMHVPISFINISLTMTIYPHLFQTFASLCLPSVWPDKNRQMSIKVAQKWFH